jgi:hypothetical protein
MRGYWKLFHACCYLQLLLTALHCIVSFIGVFQYLHPLHFFLRTIAFGLFFWLAAFGLSIYKKLFPDQPVTGKDKKYFNRLFLINFFLSVFLFALVFSEMKELQIIRRMTGLNYLELPFAFYIQLIAYLLILVFHLLILSGLYNLRLLLDHNFRKKKFDFENQG